MINKMWSRDQTEQDSSEAARVFATLHAHKDRVNCVTWIRRHGRGKADSNNIYRDSSRRANYDLGLLNMLANM